MASKINKLIPDYMVTGERGMADMGEMEMPLPDNTLPMMTGTAQFGPVEMGGMFTTVKVREGQARNDYKDPGDYAFPKGSQAYEWTGESQNPVRAPSSRGGDIDPATGRVKELRARPAPPLKETTVTVRKPGAASGGHQH